MDDSDETVRGELFGIPYNFEPPTIGRMLAAYWRPDEEMAVEKPFGIGYTLNMANWRAWVVLAVAGVLHYQEQSSKKQAAEESDREPVEVVVNDD
ncbi:DUF5808 domain-containing protein [Candidatus Halobonum tyrrellensis]|uniref:DUF5808 domain-containing protein n=1 Tax=Candidatus Halobonum tyrrellensis G22 TaxID=1324957 RepID=V4HGF4_9EURY|nr:DUF5808 domain-containing protein [Candidatus Halobonum tyrrellensis]ESP89198.1 hypothetical protein K933_05188 [Candidatus Halobonum tyrrellensis G22]